jgi:hypothetical protein
MPGMRSLKRASDSQSQFSRKPSRSSILETDSWMPSAMQAISPLVDRLMLLIVKDRNVFREQNPTSSCGKRREMPSCTAINKTQKQRYRFAAAAGPVAKYPSS